jgi:hypothetical protein
MTGQLRTAHAFVDLADARMPYLSVRLPYARPCRSLGTGVCLEQFGENPVLAVVICPRQQTYTTYQMPQRLLVLTAPQWTLTPERSETQLHLGPGLPAVGSGLSQQRWTGDLGRGQPHAAPGQLGPAVAGWPWFETFPQHFSATASGCRAHPPHPARTPAPLCPALRHPSRHAQPRSAPQASVRCLAAVPAVVLRAWQRAQFAPFFNRSHGAWRFDCSGPLHCRPLHCGPLQLRRGELPSFSSPCKLWRPRPLFRLVTVCSSSVPSTGGERQMLPAMLQACKDVNTCYYCASPA